MLGPLTYVAIAALTKERLESVEQQLLAKIRSQQNVSQLERQVYFLARTARESLSQPPHLPTQTSLPPFARTLSQYAVFGSSSPSFPRFAAMFAPGQGWLANTIHSGNPDSNRQRVLAGSTDFLLELINRGMASVNASDVADKATELKRLRAVILGHACHIGADLVSAPFVSATAWQLGTATRRQLTPDQVADAIDKAVAQLFRRDLVTSPTLAARGDLYRDWWLARDALPAGFFDAYKTALETIYGPGARPKLRPAAAGPLSPSPQVSQAFWKQFSADAPPDLSVRLLQDGYDAFRSVVESRYTWNYGDWLAGTAWIFLPPIAAYPLIVAFPHTRALFKDGALVDDKAVDTDLGWFGLVMAPLATSSLAPIVLSIYISAFTYFGVGRETIFGWVAGGVNFVTSIIGLASIAGDVAAWVRWFLLFGIPFVGLLIHGIYVLARGGSDPRHLQLGLGSLIPCIITAIYVVFHLAWHQSQDLGMNGWLKVTDGQREEWGNGGFIGGWVLWAVLLIGAWLIVSCVLVQNKDSEPSADQFVSAQRHFVRLFGHSSLFDDANLAQAASLARHYFPTDRRPVLKLWWAGAGDLFMRSDRNALHFSTSADGTGNPQVVLAPAAPMSASEFASFLNQAVKEGANFSKNLNAELFDPTDFDYVLASGEVFADAGDEKRTVAEHAADAAKFVKLGISRDAATVLFHAPRAHLAGFEGQRGPVLVDADRAVAVPGPGMALFGGLNVAGDLQTRFASFFQPGDVIATTGVAAGNEARIVASVQDDSTLTVTQPFTIAALHNYERQPNTRDVDTTAGTLQETATFRQFQGANFDSMFIAGDTLRTLSVSPPVPGTGTATFAGVTVTGDGTTTFTTFFQIGDIIATHAAAGGDEYRIVSAIANNNTLTVSQPFSGAVGAQENYRRYRGVAGAGTVTLAGTAVTGDANTRFRSFFNRGDVITTAGVAAREENRIVESVVDDRNLTVSAAFTLAVAGAAYQRLVADVESQRTVTAVGLGTQLTLDRPLPLAPLPGPATPPLAACWRVGRLSQEGFRYTPQSPVGVFGAESLMERAASLSAILCMGAASHTLTAAERAPVFAGPNELQHNGVNPVYQVFRNWNLQHRRINEWKTLIGGGAVSEKRGAPASADPLQPRAPAGWNALTPTGEAVANQLGWVPLVEKWLDVARRPGVDSLADVAFREGDPTNKKLSEAIAYLLDLPMPA